MIALIPPEEFMMYRSSPTVLATHLLHPAPLRSSHARGSHVVKVKMVSGSAGARKPNYVPIVAWWYVELRK